VLVLYTGCSRLADISEAIAAPLILIILVLSRGGSRRSFSEQPCRVQRILRLALRTRVVDYAMKHLLRCTALLLTFGFLTGCGMSEGEARQKLADLNVEYSKESFVDHAAQGDATVVELFLKSGLSTSGPEVQEALAKAIENGHSEVARTLMEAEVELRGAEQQGKMLIAAVRSGSIETVRLLLETGADPNFVYDRESKQ